MLCNIIIVKYNKGIFIIKLFFFILWFLIPVFGESNISIVLEGLDSQIEYNIRKQLSCIQYDSKSTDLDISNQINNIIQCNLKALGYYEPKIKIIFPVINTDDKKLHTVIVRISLGDPVRNIKININIYGEGKDDPDYYQIIKDSRFFLGKILNHSDYEKCKMKLYNLAISKGYVDAKFQINKLIVIPDLYQSIWDIHFYTGNRYMIESVIFQGSQIQEGYLKNISNISIGKFYQADSIMELNRRLFATNWFESIFVSSEPITCCKKKLCCMCC